MATAEEVAGEQSNSPPRTSIQPPGSKRIDFSIHEALGGGAVADVILWKRRNAAAVLFSGATAAWFLFEIVGYRFLSFLANVLLLLVSILFVWARSASILNRPLPPLPNLEIPDRVAEKFADESRSWINRFLFVAREIALEGDRKLFLQVIAILWITSYIGSFFSFLTLAYICIITTLVIPVMYDKHQDQIHEKLELAHQFLLKQYEIILTKTGRSVAKAKKTQ